MSGPDSVLLVVTTDLVANPAAISELQQKFAGYDVHQQLLERLTEHVVNIPRNKYSRVHFCGGNLPGSVIETLYDTLVDGGKLTGEIQSESNAHLIVAGFIKDTDGAWIKKNAVGATAVSLQLRRPVKNADHSVKKSYNPFKRAATNESPLTPPNEAELEDDDGNIDEDDLITDSSIGPAYNFPAKCDPGPGKKRRRACKDCTCGLKEAEEAEEEQARQKQSTVLLNKDEIAEIDFTVPGKAVGGCGSCALGDAFRCDGCPYLGLPPFKPGEVVSIDQFGDDF